MTDDDDDDALANRLGLAMRGGVIPQLDANGVVPTAFLNRTYASLVEVIRRFGGEGMNAALKASSHALGVSPGYLDGASASYALQSRLHVTSAVLCLVEADILPFSSQFMVLQVASKR